jgi:hypothetical protein
MKKLFLIAIISGLFTSGQAIAWEKIATNLNQDGDFYLASQSIRKEGNKRFVWELLNHPEGSRDGYRSAKVQNEYDCSNNRFRLLYVTIHSEHFAKGTTQLMIQSPQQWNSIPRGTIGSIVKDYVCKF